jgi:NADH:ubiquinone oxidoreductase subunit E
MIDLQKTIQIAHDHGVSLKRCLMELRQKYGGISVDMLLRVKETYGCSDDELAEITRWFPKLKAGTLAMHQLTICEPCWRNHQAMRERLDSLQREIGAEILQITFSGCLGACGLGPNALLDGQLYTQLDHNQPFWVRLESLITK